MKWLYLIMAGVNAAAVLCVDAPLLNVAAVVACSVCAWHADDVI